MQKVLRDIGKCIPHCGKKIINKTKMYVGIIFHYLEFGININYIKLNT